MLLIDESLCVRCDNCEKACAETHHGVSRLNREAGPTFATLHVPTSCRHCEHPHCMNDCPPDAIHRAPNGEVFIDDNCIGCGNCERNCPYGVIQMAAVPEKKPSLLSWLFFGRGNGPGEDKIARGPGQAHRRQARGQVRHVQGHRRRAGLRARLPDRAPPSASIPSNSSSVIRGRGVMRVSDPAVDGSRRTARARGGSAHPVPRVRRFRFLKWRGGGGRVGRSCSMIDVPHGRALWRRPGPATRSARSARC